MNALECTTCDVLLEQAVNMLRDTREKKNTQIEALRRQVEELLPLAITLAKSESGREWAQHLLSRVAAGEFEGVTQ